MNKSSFFTGQPILTQLLKFIDRRTIKSLAIGGGHDRYYKSFDTHTHLVTMLYCALNKCTSSREVVSGMKACEHKLLHLGLTKSPGKSTLCDANMKRSFFCLWLVFFFFTPTTCIEFAFDTLIYKGTLFKFRTFPLTLARLTSYPCQSNPLPLPK